MPPPPASPPSPSLMDLSADDLLERAFAGDTMAAFIVAVKSRDSASGITAEDAERVRQVAFDQPLPEPDPKIMAQLEGDGYADIFGTMDSRVDSEQRGRYLAEKPWVAQRLLELARAGAKSAYFTLKDLAENRLLNPEEMAAFRELDEPVETPPPAPTAETPPLKVLVQLLLDSHSDRLAVVDRNKLYIRRDSGTWIDATQPSPTATGVLQGMMKSVGFDVYWGQRQVDVLRSALFILMENPSAYGVSALSSYDFDRAPIFALRQGGFGRCPQHGDAEQRRNGAHRLLDQSSPGIDYRPALLNASADHPGMRLAMHFEPDPANPRFQLLRRIGFLLLGPTKAIDTIVMPTTDAGKSTFCAWLQLAFAGYVITADSTNLLSAQGQKFTSVQQRLSKWRLVLLDEADKIKSPVTEGHLNALTADSLTVESKGENSFEMPRRGNVMLVGAAAPNVELGQGGRERLHWAFDGSTVAAMSGELRALIDDPESQAWLATKVITLANDCFWKGDQAVDGGSRRAAASIQAETADPLHTALSDCLEKQDGPDGVTGEEIKERLNLTRTFRNPLRHRPSEERCRRSSA